MSYFWHARTVDRDIVDSGTGREGPRGDRLQSLIDTYGTIDVGYWEVAGEK